VITQFQIRTTYLHYRRSRLSFGGVFECSSLTVTQTVCVSTSLSASASPSVSASPSMSASASVCQPHCLCLPRHLRLPRTEGMVQKIRVSSRIFFGSSSPSKQNNRSQNNFSLSIYRQRLRRRGRSFGKHGDHCNKCGHFFSQTCYVVFESSNAGDNFCNGAIVIRLI
jgi:hypothetical protein